MEVIGSKHVPQSNLVVTCRSNMPMNLKKVKEGVRSISEYRSIIWIALFMCIKSFMTILFSLLCAHIEGKWRYCYVFFPFVDHQYYSFCAMCDVSCIHSSFFTDEALFTQVVFLYEVNANKFLLSVFCISEDTIACIFIVLYCFNDL